MYDVGWAVTAITIRPVHVRIREKARLRDAPKKGNVLACAQTWGVCGKVERARGNAFK